MTAVGLALALIGAAALAVLVVSLVFLLLGMLVRAVCRRKAGSKPKAKV